MREGGEFTLSFDATRGNPPQRVCLISFDATRRGNPARRICLILFDATRRGNPARRICLILFDATSRGNPPHRVCLFLFNATRRGNPLRRIYSTRRGGKPSLLRRFDPIRCDGEGNPPRRVYFLLNDPPSRNLCDGGLQLAPPSFKLQAGGPHPSVSSDGGLHV
jgi:hypothetical protein